MGKGVQKDYAEAVAWYNKAAEQGNAIAKYSLGTLYYKGQGVPKDDVRAYMWFNLAAVSGHEYGIKNRDQLAKMITAGQVAEGQRLSAAWQPASSTAKESKLEGTGSGFYVSAAGHVVTNQHVVSDCSIVTVNDAPVNVISTDAVNDIALLQGPGSDNIAPLYLSGRPRLGETVTAVGYPLHSLLSSGLQATSGEVSALSGVGNDSRYLQISAPVNPGNSGGPLLDSSGNVVGVVESARVYTVLIGCLRSQAL